MTNLTKAQRGELQALSEVNAVVGKSFIMRCHWHESGYRGLVRAGLVEWGDPPASFDKKRYAGTQITQAGRDALK